MTTTSINTTDQEYRGNDRVLLGFIFGLLSFWLFAMTMLNVNEAMNEDLQLPKSTLSFAISITALVSGMTIVMFGTIADRVGRVLITRIGFYLAIIGALLVATTPSGNHFLTAPILIAGRILQGLSAACIMPATLALIRDYWDEKPRQRAISLWSMGTWGGTSFAAFIGGFIASNLNSAFISGWRWIFILSTIISFVGLLLIKDVPESKADIDKKSRFDFVGMVIFMFFIVSLQLFVTMGSGWGWSDVKTLTMLGIAIVSFILFMLYEKRCKCTPFVDIKLFKNKTFTGATISNFILNGTSGVLIVTMMLIQNATKFGAGVTGYLTLGYGIIILMFIRMGEVLLRIYGPRKPMLWGCGILLLAILVMTPTNIMTLPYMILMVFGYALFGLGLAFYATPSTDAAISNLPATQSAAGSGIYKMASSLGNGFGLAISTAIYTGIVLNGRPFTAMDSLFVGRQDNIDVRHAAMMALIFNAMMIVIAILTIMLTIPKGDGEVATRLRIFKRLKKD